MVSKTSSSPLLPPDTLSCSLPKEWIHQYPSDSLAAVRSCSSQGETLRRLAPGLVGKRTTHSTISPYNSHVPPLSNSPRPGLLSCQAYYHYAGKTLSRYPPRLWSWFPPGQRKSRGPLGTGKIGSLGTKQIGPIGTRQIGPPSTRQIRCLSLRSWDLTIDTLARYPC